MVNYRSPPKESRIPTNCMVKTLVNSITQSDTLSLFIQNLYKQTLIMVERHNDTLNGPYQRSHRRSDLRYGIMVFKASLSMVITIQYAQCEHHQSTSCACETTGLPMVKPSTSAFIRYHSMLAQV